MSLLEESRLPRLQESLLRSTKEISKLEETEGYNPAVISSINRMNELRARKGQQPYTLGSNATRKAILAAQTGEAQTEAKERGTGLFDLPSNALDNLKEMGSVLSPTVLARFAQREVRGLGQVPQSISDSFSEASNPLEAVGNLASKPVFDMFSGGYNAEQLFGEEGGGYKELLRNPLITVLDVMPFFGKAASMTKAGKALEQARGARFNIELAKQKQIRDISPAHATQAKRPNRVGTVSLMKERAVDGVVTPTKFGQALNKAGRTVGNTGIGQRIKSGNSAGMAGDVSQVIAQIEEAISEGATNYAPLADLDKVNRSLNEAIGGIAKGMSDAEKALVFDRLTRGNFDMTDLPDAHQIYAQKTVDLAGEVAYYRRFGDLADEKLRNGQIFFNGQTVTHAQSQINKLNTFRGRNATAQRTADIDELARSFDARKANPQELLDELMDTFSNGLNSKGKVLSKAQRHTLGRQYLEAMRAGGYDVSALVKRNADGDLSWVNETHTWTQRELITPRQLMDKFKDQIPRKAATRWEAAIKAGRWVDARRDFPALVKNLEFDPDIKAMKFELDERVALKKVMDKQGNHAKEAKRIAKGAKMAEARFAPPSYHEITRDQFIKGAKGRVAEAAERFTPAEVANQLDMIEQGMWKSIADDVDFSGLQAEARANARKIIAESDLEPLFIHNMGRDQLGSVIKPKIIADLEASAKVSMTRTFDWSPPAKMAMLQIKGEVQEIMGAEMSRVFAEQLPEMVGGKTYKALIDDLMPEAKIIHARDTTRSLREIVDELAKKRYVGFDPGWVGQKPLTSAAAAEIWIPNHIGRLLDDLSSGGPLKGLEKLVEPITAVFRTSVLAMALRWHINNIGGGSLMYALRMTRPQDTLRYYRTAKEMLKTGDFGDLPVDQLAIGSGVGSISTEATLDAVRMAALKASKATRIGLIHSYKGGKTLRRWWDTFQEKGVARSFEFNQNIDSQFRIMSYLDEYETSLKKGMPKEAALEMAIGKSQRVMQQWTRMTPLERSLLRTVLPFYGWISHIMKYVMTYPIDHPWRTSIIANFAKSEIEDYGTGLPMKFFEMFKIGGMSGAGAQKMLDPGGLNPFRDLDAYFTMQGFFGQMHPVIGSTLESLGVDTRNGTSELYPTTYLDKESGRIAAKPTGMSGILGNLVTGVLPQAEGVVNIVASNSQFWELMETDSDAARRMLFSNWGLPSAIRNVDMPKERFKYEDARHKDQQSALNDALKSGNFENLKQYPSLAATVAQIETLAPEELELYRVDGADSPIGRLFGLTD